jgi:hypothetical protein
MQNRKRWTLALAMASTLLWLPPLEAQPDSSAASTNGCADCHLTDSAAPWRHHSEDWLRSQHSGAGVGCESCHGGNPTTADVEQAHVKVMNSANPASPTHRTNLPGTCGKCHSEQYKAFMKSRHSELLREQSTLGPTCSTCHSATGSFVYSTQGLTLRCASCHGEAGRRPIPELPVIAADVHERLSEIRQRQQQIEILAAHLRDHPRGQTAQQRLEQAKKPLAEAIARAHAFRLDDQFEKRLTEAETRTNELLFWLVEP